MARLIDFGIGKGRGIIEFQGSHVMFMLCMFLVSMSILSMVIFANDTHKKHRRYSGGGACGEGGGGGAVMARLIDFGISKGSGILEFQGSHIVFMLCMFLVSMSILSIVIFACGDSGGHDARKKRRRHSGGDFGGGGGAGCGDRGGGGGAGCGGGGGGGCGGGGGGGGGC
ncbi:hypothetical protein OSB04_005948 [Centaurea solstitialis]|uniref:Uncharacterized protein n=1 Tax=Centaurea solstitialis TaxID=347529 RepID=A0AA38TH05_9ASTR|nr:hypothetical protein OSB04_005948 [Centaurea solstitialis]